VLFLHRRGAPTKCTQTVEQGKTTTHLGDAGKRIAVPSSPMRKATVRCTAPCWGSTPAAWSPSACAGY
jgi:hypothetical protein